MTPIPRRLLDVDIPAQPDVLVQLSLLLAEDDVDLQAVSQLISSDMALAAAVLKAVNSALYGLRGRVQSVQQAITYLGTREVASVTFEMGLRAVFPPAPELEPVWERAARARPADGPHRPRAAASTRGRRIRPACSRNAARRCMFRHAHRALPADARARPRTTRSCCCSSTPTFGVSHDTLGAALCESWGLAPPAVDSVRYHVIVNSTLELPMQVPRRAICALSALAACADDRSARRSTRSPARSRRRPSSTRRLLRAARAGCRSRSRWRSSGARPTSAARRRRAFRGPRARVVPLLAPAGRCD